MKNKQELRNEISFIKRHLAGTIGEIPMIGNSCSSEVNITMTGTEYSCICLHIKRLATIANELNDNRVEVEKGTIVAFFNGDDSSEIKVYIDENEYKIIKK